MSQGSSAMWYASSSQPPVPPPRHLGKFGRLTGFSLVSCPNCGEEVIELLSKSYHNPGKVYFKCCMNEMNDPSTCKFYMFADKYKKWLDAGCPVQPYATVRRSNQPREVADQRGESSNISGLQSGLEALQASVEVLKHDVAVMKSGVDEKMGKLLNIGKIVLGCNVLVVVIVVAAVFLKH